MYIMELVMKKMILIQIFVLTISSLLIAQNQLKENDIKSTLTQIFDLSKNQDFNSLTSLLFNDKELRPFNNKSKSEVKAVKRIAKKIKAYLDLSDSYEYESLTFGKFKNLSSADLKVNFKSGDQDLTISFIFVDNSNRILLAEFK